jgi:aminopeptidase N
MPSRLPVPRLVLTPVTGLVLGLVLGLAGCSGEDPEPEPGALPTPDDLSVARSETREDSVYPEVGDPLVDALHYGLSLAWDPRKERLSAHEVLTFRATDDAERIPLDFSDALKISEVTVDGESAEFTHEGKDLSIDRPVQVDQQYEVELRYAGRPQPTPAPSTRSDFQQGLGWNITEEHETWTLQEPYGAHTWYAANDHPSDKALYDLTLTVPEPWHGVANGELTQSTVADGVRTNTWHLSEPASSYLVTVAFGDFQKAELASTSGVPIQVWSDADGEQFPGETESAVVAMAWLEEILGPYPFDTFGVLVVDNESGMETQTMITLGETDYALSAPVMVHELAHHWYGDTVSPDDWSEVWMNEGMAMYLQGMWEAEQEGITVAQKMDTWAEFEGLERKAAGPPGAYDPQQFGSGNIYYGPALMWHELRERIGDERFFAMVRAWPEQQENDTADREEYLAWIEDTTGEEFSAFFDAWLLGKKTPPR